MSLNEFHAEHFSMEFEHEKKWYPAVTDLNMHIDAGEMVALIGESGCGKSITALSMMGLQPKGTRLDGHMYLDGENGPLDLNKLTQKEWMAIRGSRISMIFQEPMTALNPLIKVGKQVRECLLEHQKTISKKEAKRLVLEQLRSVGLPDVDYLYECYPHQLSGGQRQRVMIAMAFINNPALLIADEPTTALDVTIQAQIMELMRQMNQKTNTAILLISHDLGVVSRLCSRVYIMYAGRIVESGPVKEILAHPFHPYTKGLVEAIPDLTKRGKPLKAIPGSVPGLYARSNIGCGFAGRCEYCTERCKKEVPPLVEKGARTVACWNMGFTQKEANDARNRVGIEAEGLNQKGGRHD